METSASLGVLVMVTASGTPVIAVHVLSVLTATQNVQGTDSVRTQSAHAQLPGKAITAKCQDVQMTALEMVYATEFY